MKNFFIILLISFISFTAESKVSKKSAQYTGKALIEKQIMIDAGGWYLVLNQCEGTYAKKFKERLGVLSWEDYKNFNQGQAKYASGYNVTKCNKQQNTEVIEWLDGLIDYIKNELRSDITSIENNKKTEEVKKTNDNDEDIELKLSKLKSLFDKKLITQDEYDAKRKEILDAM